MRQSLGGLSGAPSVLYPSASDFSDSLDATEMTVNGYSTIRSNALASLRLQATAGCSLMVVAVNNNVTTRSDMHIGVTVDGVFSTILPAASSSLQFIPITLDPRSSHAVELTHGWCQYGNAGSWIYAVSCNGGSPQIVRNPYAARRLVIFGDSIAVGALASPIPQYGWVQRLRATYPGRIAMQGWGGATAGDWNGFASAALLAERLVGLCFGASTREIWDEMGYNDWAGGWQLSSCTSQLGVLYDAVHAIDPTVRIWCQTPLLADNEAATNSRGNTIAEFRAAKSAAATNRPWVTVVDGTALLAAGNLADGVHPTNSGHATIATNVGAILG